MRLKCQLLLLFLAGFLCLANAQMPARYDPAKDMQEALATKFEVGPLRINNLGLQNVSMDGVEAVDGEKYYRVSVNYQGGSTAVTAELSPVKGRVRMLRLKALVAFLPDVPVSRTILRIEPNALTLEVQAQNSTLATDFGEDIKLNQFFVRMHNTSIVTAKRPTKEVETTGEIELTARDLKTERISIAFEGEADKLTLAAEVSLPGSSFWTYDLSKAGTRNTASWVAGTLQVKNASIKIDPPNETNFGGLVADVKSLAISKIEMKKMRGGSDMPATLEKFEICASKMMLKKPAISGRLPDCFSIASIQARGQSRGEYFDVFDLDLRNAKLTLNGATFRDEKGAQFSVESAMLELKRYFDPGPREANPVDPAAKVEREISATLDLSNGDITFGGALSAKGRILKASLTFAGDPEKATGNGSASIERIVISGDIVRPIKEFVSSAQCGGSLTVGVHRVEVSDVLLAMTLRDGVIDGEARPTNIQVNFSPQYARCEWDQLVKEIVYDIPCWKNVFTVEMCRIKHRIEVHWVATLNPNPLSQVGWIRSPKFEIRNGEQKICGFLGLVPNLWLVSVSPNFNDCGQWWCNLPRDLISSLMGTWQSIFVSAIGVIVGPLAVLPLC